MTSSVDKKIGRPRFQAVPQCFCGKFGQPTFGIQSIYYPSVLQSNMHIACPKEIFTHVHVLYYRTSEAPRYGLHIKAFVKCVVVCSSALCRSNIINSKNRETGSSLRSCKYNILFYCYCPTLKQNKALFFVAGSLRCGYCFWSRYMYT